MRSFTSLLTEVRSCALCAEHLLHGPLHFTHEHQFQVRSSGRGGLRKAQLPAGLGLSPLDVQQGDGRDHGQRDFLRTELFQLGFDVGLAS